LKEITERISVVEKGIKQYIKVTANQTFDIKNNDYTPKKEIKLYVYNTAKDPKELPIDGDVILPKHNIDKSITQKSLKDMQNDTTKKYMSIKEKIKTISNLDKDEIPDLEFSDKDKEILRKLELEHEKKIKNRIISSACSTIKTYEKENIHIEMDSKEKPKAKLSVRPKQCVSIIKINFHFLHRVSIFIKLIYMYLYSHFN